MEPATRVRSAPGLRRGIKVHQDRLGDVGGRSTPPPECIGASKSRTGTKRGGHPRDGEEAGHVGNTKPDKPPRGAVEGQERDGYV